jgi:hypothetical protein
MADRTLNEEDLKVVSDMKDPMWLPTLQLRLLDRVILETRNAWLNDRLIAAGMLLLKKYFTEIGGFCDPVMVDALRCHFANQTFVQVLYTGSNHWITASNINCNPGTVRVYDGMQNVPSVCVKKQLAAICQVKESWLAIQLMNVDRQKVQGDCGLLAMAHATSLCMGQDPVNFVYAQEKMRQHFMDCLMLGKVQPFPVASNRTVRKSVSVMVREKVYCICRQIFIRGQRMIDCKSCKEWYHPACTALSDSAFDEAAENREKHYVCPICVKT